jgi:hypothetical protein
MNRPSLLACMLTLGTLPASAASDCPPNWSGPSNPTSVYQIHADGTVLDIRYGLHWKRCSEGQQHSSGNCVGQLSSLNWADAVQVAGNSQFAGHSDWRLPNVKELLTLVEECRASPALHSQVFPDTAPDIYWSSSPYRFNTTHAWIVQFDFGVTGSLPRSQQQHLRLVRDWNASSR